MDEAMPRVRRVRNLTLLFCEMPPRELTIFQGSRDLGIARFHKY